jgi:SAM-dependent methyltransferase
MRKEEVFRDTKNWYLKASNYASSELINFVTQHAWKRILDVGCATGEYCKKLNALGFESIGVDINPQYVAKAKTNGVEAYCMDAKSIKFPDNSFDTVILFEVLEHVDNPHDVLIEAKRVARRNILITVPDCTAVSELRNFGLTYEHMLDRDHVNFFTLKDLENSLSRHFKSFKIQQRQRIILGAVGLPWWLQKPILLLRKSKLVKADIYFRLYAVVDVSKKNGEMTNL